MQAAFSDSIQDFAKSDDMKNNIFLVIQKWIGTKITDSPTAVSDFIEKATEREFQFEKSFKEKLSNDILGENKETPHIYARPGEKENGCYFNFSKQYERMELKFSKQFGGEYDRVEIANLDSSDFTVIKFENEEAMRHDEITTKSTSNTEYGQFVIEFTRIKTKLSVAAIGKTSEPVSPIKTTPSKSKRFSIGDLSLGGLALGQAFATASPTKESRKLIGTCVISLLEAFGKDKIAQDWPIMNGTENVGSISLVLSFNNQNCATRKETLSQLIMNKMCEEINILQESSLANTSNLNILSGTDVFQNLKPLPFDGKCNEENVTSCDIEYYVEITCGSSAGRRKVLHLFYNNEKIGNIPLMIKDVPIKCPPIQSITSDMIVIRYENGEDDFIATPHNESNKTAIRISDIPWSTGTQLKTLGTHLNLEIRGEIKEPGDNENKDLLDATKKLLRVMYFTEVSRAKVELRISAWDGNLRDPYKNILSILSPLYSHNQWQAMHSWCLLELRTIFPEISSKVCHQQVDAIVELGSSKYSEDIYGFRSSSPVPSSIEQYTEYCVSSISEFHNRDDNDKEYIEEIKYMINSLQVVHGYDNGEIKESININLIQHIRNSIAGIINPRGTAVENIRIFIHALNQYDQRLKDIQFEFGNFAVEVWCPILAFNLMDNILPRIKELLNHVKYDLSSGSQDAKEASTVTMDLYVQMKKLLRYGQSCEFDKLESSFFKAFVFWLKPWLDHIENRSKEQIETAVHAYTKKKFNQNDTCEYSGKLKVSKTQSFDLGFLDEIEGAKDVVGIIQSIIRPKSGMKPWQDIFYPFHKKGEDPDIQFLYMLHNLFLFYLSLLEEHAIKDNEFERAEYANIILSAFHVKYQYLDDFYGNEIAIHDTNNAYLPKVEQMRSDVMKKVYSITNQFCSCQKKYFEMYLGKKDDGVPLSHDQYWNLSQGKTTGAHIEDILKFCMQKRQEYGQVNEESLSQKGGEQLFQYLLKTLFKLEEQVIREYYQNLQSKRKSSVDHQAHKNIRNMITSSLCTRSEFRFDENDVINNINTDIEYRSSTTLQLISKHLKLIHESQTDQLENAGSVKYIVGRVGKRIYIHLKAVDLKPRDEKDACNFKISVLLIPNQKGTSPFCSKKQTNVYDQKKYFAFEIEDPKNANSYQFHFDLAEKEDEEEEDQKDDEVNHFLELDLYDISTLKEVFSKVSKKYFRGHTLLSIDRDTIPNFSTDQEFMEYSHKGEVLDSTFVFTDALERSSNVKRGAYDQLKLRDEILKDEVAKSYIEHRNKQHKNYSTSTKID